jgi:chromate reductase, NAD(P)H dehydrogenase (quinone)
VPHILTLCGSLRTKSSNAALLAAAGHLAPAGVTVTRYLALAALPAFSPDLDTVEGEPAPPAAVSHLRSALQGADAVLVSSPEYAHGLPGALKNALDWVVGSGELVGKPVGVLSASAASQYAHPQLVEVLATMTAVVVPGATRVINIPRRGADAAALVADPACAVALREVVGALVAAANGHQVEANAATK